MKFSFITIATLVATAIAAPSGGRKDYSDDKDLSKGKEEQWNKDYYDSGNHYVGFDQGKDWDQKQKKNGNYKKGKDNQEEKQGTNKKGDESESKKYENSDTNGKKSESKEIEEQGEYDVKEKSNGRKEYHGMKNQVGKQYYDGKDLDNDKYGDKKENKKQYKGEEHDKNKW